jgi:hypothetical protein
MIRTHPDWFTRARKKWSAEMAQAKKRHRDALQPAYCMADIRHIYRVRARAVTDIRHLRAQALALVLIERASR